MRVSAETKAATRQSILDAAIRLFASRGFQSATTRDIAEAAGIATGTLFNYFPAKEAIVACLAGQAIEQANAEFQCDSHRSESLDEELFSLVAISLRKLKPLRSFLPSLLETSLSPLASDTVGDSASLRVLHLEAVVTLAGHHGIRRFSSIALQLYWTLFAGILVFWANDKSPKQEDTLALIDQSLTMFAGWLRDQAME